MLVKSRPINIKAAGTEDGLVEGQFRAVVSVFGNKDSYGDKVMPGAFADTLQEWRAKGDPIPVFWSHQMSDPEMCIGYVDPKDAVETDIGLEVLGQIDIGDDASPKAKQSYRLLKERRVTQFSFAYDIEEAAWVETDDEWWYELRKLKLHELGPTPIGANQETELLAVKSAAEHATKFVKHDLVKAGRVLSAKNETTLREAQASLEDAATQIKSVLAAVETDDSETSNDEKAKAGEQHVHPSLSDQSALLEIELADAS